VDLLVAKSGILLTSLIAGIGDFIWLYLSCDKQHED